MIAGFSKGALSPAESVADPRQSFARRLWDSVPRRKHFALRWMQQPTRRVPRTRFFAGSRMVFLSASLPCAVSAEESYIPPAVSAHDDTYSRWRLSRVFVRAILITSGKMRKIGIIGESYQPIRSSLICGHFLDRVTRHTSRNLNGFYTRKLCAISISSPFYRAAVHNAKQKICKMLPSIFGRVAQMTPEGEGTWCYTQVRAGLFIL